MEDAARLKKIQKGLKTTQTVSNIDDLKIVYQSPKSGKLSDHQSNIDTQSRACYKDPHAAEKRLDRQK